MKKANYLFIVLFVIFVQDITAQTSQKINAPALIDPATNCVLRYYYYPNLEAYFDTRKNVYLFSQNGEWITAKELPTGYRGYSLYNKNSIFILDYDDDDILQFIKLHKKKYPYQHNGRTKSGTQTARQ